MENFVGKKDNHKSLLLFMKIVLILCKLLISISGSGRHLKEYLGPSKCIYTEIMPMRLRPNNFSSDRLSISRFYKCTHTHSLLFTIGWIRFWRLNLIFARYLWTSCHEKNIKIKGMSMKALVYNVKHPPSGKIWTYIVFFCAPIWHGNDRHY